MFFAVGGDNAKGFAGLRAHEAGQIVAIARSDIVSDVIGIDRSVWILDVPQDGRGVAMREVAEVGPDRRAFATDAMAGGAFQFFAEEQFAAALIIAADDLRFGFRHARQGNARRSPRT